MFLFIIYSKLSAPILHLLDVSSTSGISGQSFLVFWLQKYYFFFSFIITLGNICWALSLCHLLCQAFFMTYNHCYSPEISYSCYSQPQKRKVRNWEINYFGWSHSTNKWWSQGWNTGSLTQELVLSASRCYIAFIISISSHLFLFESRCWWFHFSHSYLSC